MDGREKKRNFESAKKSVDHSSQYFRYYMSRVCGIASEPDAEGKKVFGDPMLSLVASIHLNEAVSATISCSSMKRFWKNAYFFIVMLCT